MAAFLSIACYAAELQLEIIPLKHRPAETLIDQIRPHMARNSTISASGNSLIIRSTAENIAQLHVLIDELDTPLAQLMISVRQGDRVGTSTKGYNSNTVITSGNSSIKIGNDGSRTITSKSNGGITTRIENSSVTIRRSTGTNNSGGISQVRATEGYPAYIHTGQQVPYTTSKGYGYDRYRDQEYKDVIKGVYVTPRIVGDDSVNLEIKVSNDKVKEQHKRNPNIQTQGYQGVVSGQLGQWIPLGSINITEEKHDEGLGRSYRTSRSQDLNIYLKVDRVN
ncbi:secretin N-terminal domain-containing protein [Maricurvus nonylphenolicus]